MKLAKSSFNVLMFQCEAFWILFNFFILNSLVQATSDSVKTNDCPKSVDHCAKNMKGVLNDTRFTFPRNDHQLDILCLHLNRTITCINKFIECDLTSNVKKDTFNGLLQLMEKLCSKSSKFRIEYLKHAECYHKLAPVYTKCYQLYYESERQRIELNRNITTSQHLILWCCNYKNHRKCTTDPVSRFCGSDAANLAEQIVIISEGQDSLDHCPKHIITSSTCLKQWESLGLLVNTTYTSNGNIEFLSDEDNSLYPDRISSSASGSLSSLVTRKCNDNHHLNPLTLLVNPFIPSILQSIALIVIILVYNYFNVFRTFPVKCCSQSQTLATSKDKPFTQFSYSRATLPATPSKSNGALKDFNLSRLSLVKEKT
uniref:Secreted salivary gland n=1 Tax=Tetranychus evansi TaxID=178897 RepID=A0A3G5APL7_9ACAR|nr:secreted salivary gland [Tetranychus evansi]